MNDIFTLPDLTTISQDALLGSYTDYIDRYGLDAVWAQIVSCKQAPPDNASDLYEIGLAHVDKSAKKAAGKYYTPEDVAKLMATWLLPLEGTNVCDVCCGTGNLIVVYLKLLGVTTARDLIEGGHLYLYDTDCTALKSASHASMLFVGKTWPKKSTASQTIF